MNLNFSPLIVLIVICAQFSNASGRLSILDRLFNLFRSSPAQSNDQLNDNILKPSVSTFERSSLISDDDIKFTANGHLLNKKLFKQNLVRRLQDMISRKSIDTAEQARIVNVEADEAVKHPCSIDMDTVNELADSLSHQPSSQWLYGQPTDLDDDEESKKFNDEEDDEDEDDDELGFRKKSADEQQSNQTSINSTNSTIYSSSLGNHTLVNHHNQTYRIFNTTSQFYNSTNTTSYTYLGDRHQQSSQLDAVVENANLLGNTLYSIDHIFRKYIFINLYPAPTINDTHNDDDLHQKDSNQVVLKANYAKYPGYSNTVMSIIPGPKPPVQNDTDIKYGNSRLLKISSTNHTG